MNLIKDQQTVSNLKTRGIKIEIMNRASETYRIIIYFLKFGEKLIGPRNSANPKLNKYRENYTQEHHSQIAENQW